VHGGVLDRAALRGLVLADRAALRRLERILHPLVRRAQRRFIAAARVRGVKLVVLDIPLLLETGGDRAVDHVVVVTAPAALQIARVRARRRMSDSDIRAMIALQMPDRAKRAKADTLIHTGLSRNFATRQVRRLVHRLGGP
jgi:dephospho-CoA kinase